MKRRYFLNHSTLLLASTQLGALSAAGLLQGCGSSQTTHPSQNRMQQKNLVATQAAFNPLFVEPDFANAWGLAIRPAGAGGHFWVTAGGKSYEYVGDVNGTPLFQDTLKDIALPRGANDEGFATGTIFNPTTGFAVSNAHPNGAITAPAKFLFATDNGVISAWTERSNQAAAQGKDWPAAAHTVIDMGAQGAAFFGLAIVASSQLLIVADFGVSPQLRVFDAAYQALNHAGFKNPFATGVNGAAKPGDYVPFNATTLTFNGAESVFVSFAKSQPDPTDASVFYAGEEDSAPGHGRLVQYSADGAMVSIWADAGMLNSPWGVALAPANFGVLSNHLLVGNFGSGRITAFNTRTHKAVADLNDAAGKPVVIEGLWAILFGNGASLGDNNALYFAAGPAEETQGLFGSLRAI